MQTFWLGKRVLVTGHTGFKGSWLSIWLRQMGASVNGYALEPRTEPSLFNISRLDQIVDSNIGDIRDLALLQRKVEEFRPDIIFHLAAQPLVRQSYSDPIDTFSTNVMGTVNLLEAVRHCSSVRVVINITTDKVYENQEWVWGYRENEKLGGKDPYSASKACAELVTKSYADSFFPPSSYQDHGVSIATVRAGNIIGGGDWSQNRLIPDCLRAFERNEAVTIRNPYAVRPWQHVLGPLQGYLLLAQQMYQDTSYQGAWNFGPQDQDAQPVHWVVEQLRNMWGSQHPTVIKEELSMPEAQQLKLDSSKARTMLNWQPKWDLKTSLGKIIEWHHAYLSGSDVQELCLQQIKQYESGELPS